MPKVRGREGRDEVTGTSTVRPMNSSRGKSACATARPIKSLRGRGMMKSTGTTAPSHEVFERERQDEVYRY